MMTRLIAKIFEPEDFLLLEPQEAQLLDIPQAQRLEYGWQFKEGGSAFTLWEGARPIVCCGALRRHPGYVQLWALFSRHKSRVPVQLTRIVRRYIASLSEAVVEAQVAASNGGACGWARLIGLEEETRLRARMPDGSDMVVFVKPQRRAG